MSAAVSLLPPVRLGVNVDHVATLRNARDGLAPDPVRAAQLACAAGADGITAHLREDRRHIRDADMRRLREVLTVPLNFEMAATAEMVAIACDLAPHACCLVPERREERTTEGGLDVLGSPELGRAVDRLRQSGIRVSLFIAADTEQVRAAADIGAEVVEFHTGTWCEMIAAGDGAAADEAFSRLAEETHLATSLGLEVHAGHGLDYQTAERICSLKGVRELNIGHFLIGEAVFVGLESAIRRMRSAMAQGRTASLEIGRGS